jgi:hypothetical protein
MPSDAPKIVYPLAATALIFGVLQVPCSVFLAVKGESLGIITAFGALALTLQAIRTLSTRVTEAGASQLTWSGRVHLSWTEVTQVTRTPLSITLTGEKRKVVVPVEVFENTAAAISYIESHLPSHLNGNGCAGTS